MRHEHIILSRNGPQTTKESLARPRHSSACSALSEEEQAKPRKRNTLSPKCDDMSLQPYQYKRYKIFVLQHMGHPSYGNSMIEGSFEGKLPTIWTHEKQTWEESEKRKEEKKKEDQRRERKKKKKKKEDAGVQKGRKAAKPIVIPLIRGSGELEILGSAFAETAGVLKFGKMTNEKLHALVARKTCPSQSTKSKS